MKEVFGPGGLLARHHPNYEFRPGQIDMARAVNDTVRDGGVALIEAGTGTGKTLAYLIPVLAADQRVIVSTATKNLQEQLFHKDIPFLKDVIPRKFTATLMKGRSNYVCLHKLKKAASSPILEGLDELDHFERIRQWAGSTETGDRAELSDLPENLPFWHQIDARAESCIGQKCPDFDACFITRMRREALESDVVVVNHHLFFADLGLKGGDYGGVLPEYSSVIFDEAHEIEDIAASYFGSSVSNLRVNDVIQDASRLDIQDARAGGELNKALARLAQRSDQFFLAVRALNTRGDGESYTGPRGRRRHSGEQQETRSQLRSVYFATRDRSGALTPTPAGEAYVGLVKALDLLISTLRIVKDPPAELDNVLRRAQTIRLEVEFIVTAEEPQFVFWYECRGRGVFLNATPIDVSTILRESLFNSVRSAVLTSATMTAADSFEFLRSRLGIDQARELVIESHFDFSTQAVLYLPRRMPDPRTREFIDASAEEIVKIIEATQGRAFVLFTSVAAMRDTYEMVRYRVDFPSMIQGEASKTSLLERFRKTPGSVLFATASFWQGVDVQGEALSCVIIAKLPFAVPTDPVVAARQKYIEDKGGNSFYEYSVPEAVITLKQGLGRLIRSTSDRGVLSVLDPRLLTKSYGKVFLESLPPARITHSIEDAAKVFNP